MKCEGSSPSRWSKRGHPRRLSGEPAAAARQHPTVSYDAFMASQWVTSEALQASYMVSCPLKNKRKWLYNLSPLHYRCRLSGRREPHLAANFAPVLSAKKITSARRADNNRAAKKVLVVTSTWEGSKLATKLIPPPTALRIRAFCCGLHWLKTAVGGWWSVTADVTVSSLRWVPTDTVLVSKCGGRSGCLIMG